MRYARPNSIQSARSRRDGRVSVLVGDKIYDPGQLLYTNDLYGGVYGYYAPAPSLGAAPTVATYSTPAPAGPSMPPMQGPSQGGPAPSGPQQMTPQQQQEIAKWGAVGQVGSALASMTGMIAGSIISNRGAQKLAEQQAKYARQAAPGQAMLAEKQSLLANAQAALTSAQNAYIWPLALVGVTIVGGLAFYVTSTKKEKLAKTAAAPQAGT